MRCNTHLIEIVVYILSANTFSVMTTSECVYSVQYAQGSQFLHNMAVSSQAWKIERQQLCQVSYVCCVTQVFLSIYRNFSNKALQLNC
jgi:hypothetical protein